MSTKKPSPSLRPPHDRRPKQTGTIPEQFGRRDCRHHPKCHDGLFLDSPRGLLAHRGKGQLNENVVNKKANVV